VRAPTILAGTIVIVLALPGAAFAAAPNGTYHGLPIVTATINGARVRGVPAVDVDGQPMVPASAVAAQSGGTMQWDPGKMTVVISAELTDANFLVKTDPLLAKVQKAVQDSESRVNAWNTASPPNPVDQLALDADVDAAAQSLAQLLTVGANPNISSQVKLATFESMYFTVAELQMATAAETAQNYLADHSTTYELTSDPNYQGSEDGTATFLGYVKASISAVKSNQ